MKRTEILNVNKDRNVLVEIADGLNDSFVVDSALGGKKALEMLQKKEYQAILIDFQTSDIKQAGFFTNVERISSSIPLLFYKTTGEKVGEDQNLQDILFINTEKPGWQEELTEIINSAIQFSQLKKEPAEKEIDSVSPAYKNDDVFFAPGKEQTGIIDSPPKNKGGPFIVVLDSEGRILHFNFEFFLVSGKILKDSLGHYFWDMFDGDRDQAVVYKAVKNLSSQIFSLQFETGKPRKSEGDDHYLWSLSRFKTGKTEFLVAAGNKEKYEKKTVAENNWNLNDLDDVEYAVTHNLRSSINIVMSFQDKGEQGAEQLEKLLVKLKDQTQEALQVIDKVHQLSRAGKKPEFLETIDLKELFQKIFLTLNVHHIPVEFNTPQVMPTLQGDLRGMEWAFTNLIANAIEFRDSEKQILIIDVGYELLEGAVKICVKDNGLGLNKNELSSIFKPGYTRRGTSRASGFGLAITRRIIEAQGGEIYAESDGERQGSEFYVILPEK